MMQFKAFKPEGLNKIAGAMGYKGDMSKFQDFIEQDPRTYGTYEYVYPSCTADGTWWCG